VEIALGSGKDKADQRHSLKEKAEKREVDREVSRFNRTGTRRT
jgi:tmRNA-binding protein